jgi:hypothetical protein
MDATDHTITSFAAAEKVAHFCLLWVYKELKKLPVFFLPFVLISSAFSCFVRMGGLIMEWSGGFQR